MIFLSVGTQKFSFNRLLKIIDDLIEKQIIKDIVICQCGYSDYAAKHFKCIPFLSHDDFDKLLDECDLFIVHGGVGSILAGLEKNKKIIAFPRKKVFHEHIDDHQFQICEKFFSLNLLKIAIDAKSLEREYKDICKFVPAKFEEVFDVDQNNIFVDIKNRLEHIYE